MGVKVQGHPTGAQPHEGSRKGLSSRIYGHPGAANRVPVCDAPIPRGPLITRQPAEYSWMSGNLPDTHENRAESPLYGELYPDTSPVPTSIT